MVKQAVILVRNFGCWKAFNWWFRLVSALDLLLCIVRITFFTLLKDNSICCKNSVFKDYLRR